MSISIDQLPPEIQALVGAGGLRSPVRQPLKNLETPANPRERLNRPTFFFEGSAAPTTPTEYPKVKWALKDGRVQERRVENAAEEAALSAEWQTAPPLLLEPTTQAALQKELASLSEEDRQWVIEQQRAHRRQALTTRLASLSDTDLAAVTAEDTTIKRGPGRPRKHDGA